MMVVTSTTSAQRKCAKVKTACQGHRLPMKALNQLIVERVLVDLLNVKTISEILEPMRNRQAKSKVEIAQRLADRETEVLETKKSLDNLYDLVAIRLTPASGDASSRFRRSLPEWKKNGTKSLLKLQPRLG